jgi:hypothetical protein
MLLINWLKIFLNFWSIILTIDHKNLIWPMAINPSVHTQLIVSIHRSNLQYKKINFPCFFPWQRKSFQLLLKTTVKSLKLAKVLKIFLEAWPIVLITGKKIDFWPIVLIHRLMFFSSDGHWSIRCFLPSIDYWYRCFFGHQYPPMVSINITEHPHLTALYIQVHCLI